jgi:hypothetical protein
MQFTANIRESLSLHGFDMATHADSPLFFLKLRFQHPHNPIDAGIATEPDFPKNLLALPPEQTENGLLQHDITSTTSTPPPNNRRRDLDAFDYMLQSPAFYNKSSTSSAWDVHESQPVQPEDPSIPSQISTISKRPHLSTGDTLHKPPKQKTRNQDACDSKTAPSTDSPSTTSNTNFSEHQTEHMDADDDSEEEFIPDSQYPFCLDHSQPTRIEVQDALGTARAISEKRFQETYHFIANHGNSAFDLTLLKSIACRPPTPTRAHNDTHAQPRSTT